jgi:hypothetical protein
MRRTTVPVAVKSDIPFEVADDFNVVGGVRIEPHAPWIRHGRQKGSGQIEVGLAEPEKSCLCKKQACRDIFAVRHRRTRTSGVVMGILPGSPTEQCDGGPVCILQIATQAATKRALIFCSELCRNVPKPE